MHVLLKILLIIFPALSFLLDAYTIYQYGYPFNSGIFDVIMSTNYNEAIEYINQFITIKILLFLFFAFVGAFFGGYVAHYVINRYVSNRMILFLFSVLFALNVLDMIRIGGEEYRQILFKSMPGMRLVEIGRIEYASAQLYEEYEKEDSKNEVSVTRDDSDIPYVIFILGESTSRNHMSIYGYDLDTTPRLKKRLYEEELYIFTDVVSHHSHTLPVMRELFTFYRRGMNDEWFHYVNLFSILQKTDYHTVWLSNQEVSGLWSLDKFYSQRCDEKHFTDLRGSTDDSLSLDGALLPMLDNVKEYEKNFIVVHLMGTHVNYKKRYPHEFERFSALDEEKGINNNQKQIRAEYDNAVLYNDYIVDSIIDRFKDKDAMVIYVSDHADEVYEDRDFVGHTESLGTKYMIEVPFLIWTSNTFKRKRPDLTSRIASGRNRPFMTDDMIHVILDILSIETVDYNPKRSLINEKYEKTLRIFNNADYDQ